jgi:hypothetical protein
MPRAIKPRDAELERRGANVCEITFEPVVVSTRRI